MTSDYRFRLNRYWQLSICKRFSIFRSEFSTIPHKISAYLQSDSSSGANTRKTRCFLNALNVNNLCLKVISTLCNMHHFGMRNGPFQGMKSTISHHEIGFFGLRYGQYQNARLIFSDYVIGYMKTRYGLKRPL